MHVRCKQLTSEWRAARVRFQEVLFQGIVSWFCQCVNTMSCTIHVTIMFHAQWSLICHCINVFESLCIFCLLQVPVIQSPLNVVSVNYIAVYHICTPKSSPCKLNSFLFSCPLQVPGNCLKILSSIQNWDWVCALLCECVWKLFLPNKGRSLLQPALASRGSPRHSSRHSCLHSLTLADWGDKGHQVKGYHSRLKRAVGIILFSFFLSSFSSGVKAARPLLAPISLPPLISTRERPLIPPPPQTFSGFA